MEERKLTKVQTVRDASAEMLTLVSTAKYTSRSPQPLKVGHILHEWTPPPIFMGNGPDPFIFGLKIILKSQSLLGFILFLFLLIRLLK